MVLFCVQFQSSTVGLGLCTGNKKWSNKKNIALKVPKQHDRVCGAEISNTFKDWIFQEIFQLEKFRKITFQSVK